MVQIITKYSTPPNDFPGIKQNSSSGGGSGVTEQEVLDLIAANTLSESAIEDLIEAAALTADQALVLVRNAIITDNDNYTVLATDASKYIRLTAAGAKTITIQTNATQALPDNADWHFRNAGAGDATISPAGGVTVNLPINGSLVIPQGGTITLKRIASNTFDLIGITA